METINILCSTDDKYVPYCGIMLTSLFENNRPYTLCTYILTEGLHPKNRSLFSQLAERYNTSIYIVQVSDERIAQCPMPPESHLTSLVTYYRLLAPNLLPLEVKRIIYLDCDMIVDGDIESLWNEPVENVALGAVIDESHYLKATSRRLDVLADVPTFNSGMLLINVEYWRKHAITEQCFDYIHKFPDRIRFHDQDVLNHIVMNSRVLLPIRYNFQTGFLYQGRQLDDAVLVEVEEAMHTPVIVHYTAGVKPWSKYSYVKRPFRSKYLYYRSISLWKNYPLVCWSVPQLIQFFLYRIACTIGIRKRVQLYIMP
ncbi:MAG: glycosyltransferase family 8 protein [Prevotellaceae bacterium]|jgi:lipopolysaccharide biosynthesis glycosyltransferase|nr:glycosyltransferase family 8 protein [Prevotellaceae bacterium]